MMPSTVDSGGAGEACRPPLCVRLHSRTDTEIWAVFNIFNNNYYYFYFSLSEKLIFDRYVKVALMFFLCLLGLDCV